MLLVILTEQFIVGSYIDLVSLRLFHHVDFAIVVGPLLIPEVKI
jgi:hypothetical protein